MTDLRVNRSIACEEHKGKSGFKAFLISHMKMCPASAAHRSISETQVSAQGRQKTIPLPPSPTEGTSHARTVLVGLTGWSAQGLCRRAHEFSRQGPCWYTFQLVLSKLLTTPVSSRMHLGMVGKTSPSELLGAFLQQSEPLHFTKLLCH